MNEPEFGIPGCFCDALQVVGRRAQEVTSRQTLECPTTGEVVANRDLKLGRVVAFLLKIRRQTYVENKLNSCLHHSSLLIITTK